MFPFFKNEVKSIKILTIAYNFLTINIVGQNEKFIKIQGLKILRGALDLFFGF